MDEFFSFIVGIVAAILPGFGQPAVPSWNGYVEADYVYVSAPSPGTIEAVAVKQGDEVAEGAILFTLEGTQYRALVAAADARVIAAQANLKNLTTGSREDEIEVVRATLQKAEADLSLAREMAQRSNQLFAEGLTPQAKVDQDQATLKSAEAAVRQLEAQLKVAELPARDAQQWAAEANLAAAQAEAGKARADFEDRTVTAPQSGRIERLFFSSGETAGAGVPVVELLPADSLKVKFYVAEIERPDFALGQSLGVTCDGCATGLTATVSRFASQPQFTPPIIYSRDERRRLTFLVEAVLDIEGGLLPGQPVTVARLP